MAKWWQEFEKCLSHTNNKKTIIMLKKVSVLKTYDRKGNSLLHYVSKADNDNVSLATHLIKAGCDVNVKNHLGSPPLTNAILCKNVKVAKKLIDSGAEYSNVNFQNNCGALNMAIFTGCCEMVEMLLKAGVNVNGNDKDGLTPLFLAIISYSKNQRKDNGRLVKILIEAGADVNAMPNAKGCTPFIFAIMLGLNDIVQPMLNAGANVNAITMGIIAPLKLAVLNGNVPLARRLIRAGANVNSKDSDDLTPLKLAVAKDNVTLARQLIKAGADVNQPDLHKRTCLHYAAMLLNINVVKLLLENGASVNVLDEDNRSPLACITGSYNLGTIDLESDRESDEVIEATYPGQTGIKLDCIRLLLEYGADVNCKLSSDPIVYLSFMSSHSKVVSLLLKHQATVDFNHVFVETLITTPSKKNTLNQLIRHTANFQSQNRVDGISNFDLNKLEKDQQNYYTSCRNELETMKTTWILGAVTVFKLLVDKDIGPYARNEQLIKAFASLSIKKNFPIYSDLITERFSSEVRKQRLIKAAGRSLGRILPLDLNSFRLIFDNILSHLNKSDLTNLVSVR